jgi:hypothetical protein
MIWYIVYGGSTWGEADSLEQAEADAAEIWDPADGCGYPECVPAWMVD